ncbi:hypothetical protein SAMN05192573_10782 [Mucilaginibacter gossypii]|uniref:Uncharacterized protein n=1 Tax=Mucilaginibacter gossypii TaxID=551996 RepID=A0A1G8A3I6_9SPHI|nr:hypothetical protein SAMN05192573_10782 [Mucilaginibacter gossypii]
MIYMVMSTVTTTPSSMLSRSVQFLMSTLEAAKSSPFPPIPLSPGVLEMIENAISDYPLPYKGDN